MKLSAARKSEGESDGRRRSSKQNTRASRGSHPFWTESRTELFRTNLFRASTGDAKLGGIAQLVEHVLCKHEVTGSIPVASTTSAAGGGARRSHRASGAKAGSSGERAGEDGTVSGV